MITYGPTAFNSFIGKYEIQAATLLRGVVIISCLGGRGWGVSISSATFVDKHMTQYMTFIQKKMQDVF